MKRISYRNWRECYHFGNNSVSIIINASAGGRIMAYERNGINVIYENPDQDGLILKDFLETGFDPDGGRFDYGQEEITRNLHAVSYMGEWTGTIINDYSLEITSLPDPGLGILSNRIFTLNPHTSKLTITQTMKNISDKPSRYFFWGRTLVNLGGILFMPLNPESKIPGKWGRYIWQKPEKFENDPDDPGVFIKENIFSLIPAKAGNAKYGNDSHAGWMGYSYKFLIFVIKQDFFPEKVYAEKYGLTNIFYTNRTDFAEMEPVSPLAVLGPGEENSCQQDWFLFDYISVSDPDFDISEAGRFILSQNELK